MEVPIGSMAMAMAIMVEEPSPLPAFRKRVEAHREDIHRELHEDTWEVTKIKTATAITTATATTTAMVLPVVLVHTKTTTETNLRAAVKKSGSRSAGINSTFPGVMILDENSN